MKVVINKSYGEFRLSLALLDRAIKENKTSLFKTYKYGDTQFTHDWSNFVKHSLTKTYRGYKTDSYESCLYDEKSKVLYKHNYEIIRHDPNLVELVETMGKDASGMFSNVAVIEIPDGIEYEVEEYDGKEWIAEKHRTWE